MVVRLWSSNSAPGRMQERGLLRPLCLLLQESLSALLETYNKIFVTYLDVAKAFDGVWIGGIFYRLWEMGVRGRTWRLLYNSYKDFKCRVRVQGELSEWYPLRCGIHQGGYLSLIKYLAFINSLLVNLENSNLCCAIYGISVSPLGYADRVLQIVYDHSCTWRYKFNPKKIDRATLSSGMPLFTF